MAIIVLIRIIILIINHQGKTPLGTYCFYLYLYRIKIHFAYTAVVEYYL
jgi:hypothetical protein